MRSCLGEIRMRMKEHSDPEKIVVSLSPEGERRGRVLFSYIINGFLLKSGEPMPNKHTNFWQTARMAETFVELGYEVDVIHYTNSSFIPSKQYAYMVDVRHNLERLAPKLNSDCVKIMHLDTANILFHNAAEAKRLLQLQERRGITLKPRRFETPNLGIEHADYATTCGNDFTVDTFRYANKKIYKLPSPCAIILDWQEKEWERCRTSFLWFSSGGLVHKGLDLALEAFSEMPEFQLTVCAPLHREKDFVRAYHRELYETPNIKTVGWVDIESDDFREITAACGSMVNLSCSEGGTPAVKTCMHAGLIPVASCESGVDLHDFGFTLHDCSTGGIKDMIRHVASFSSDEIKARARKAWEFARTYHTRENFAKEYKRVILEIIDDIQVRGN
jgi:hypothetical protein